MFPQVSAGKILSKLLCSCSQRRAFLQWELAFFSSASIQEGAWRPWLTRASFFLPGKAVALENRSPLLSQEPGPRLLPPGQGQWHPSLSPAATKQAQVFSKQKIHPSSFGSATMLAPVVHDGLGMLCLRRGFLSAVLLSTLRAQPRTDHRPCR